MVATIVTDPAQPYYLQHFSLTYSNPGLIFDQGLYDLVIAGNVVSSAPYNNTVPPTVVTATNSISAPVVLSTAVYKTDPTKMFTLEGNGAANSGEIFQYTSSGVISYIPNALLTGLFGLTNPIAVSIDDADNLYVVDKGAATGKIAKFTPNLTKSIIMDQVQVGNRPANRQLMASDILGNTLYSVDTNGALYSTDLTNTNVATNTTYIGAFAGPITSTTEWNLTVDEDFAFVNVYGSNTIYAFRFANGTTTTFATAASAISGLCVMGTNFVYVTTNEGLYRYSVNDATGTGTLVGQVYASAGASGGGGYNNVYYIYNGTQYIQLTLNNNITLSWADVYNPYDMIFVTNLVHRSSGVVYDTFTVHVVCFLEGTRILCYNNIKHAEEFREVETLRAGETLVKTKTQGYLPVYKIGKKSIFNPSHTLRNKDRLYKLTPAHYPELERDLIVTGCHCVLVDDLSDEIRGLLIELEGDIFVTENMYRLPVYLDHRAEPFTEEGIMDVYHFALQSDDERINHAVYAEGELLVETTSKRFMDKLGNMTLLRH